MTQSAGIIATASVALAMGVGSLFAAAEPLWICCNLLSECGAKQVCCPPEILNLPPCDDEVHGYCVTLCVRVAEAK
jgi:hypothetical protein